MSNFDEINENYSSPLTQELLNSVTREEQERIDYKMMLAAKIYAALKSKGWKSLDLAQALELKSPSLISKWLSGTHNFTVDTLVDIQRVLGINLVNAQVNQSTSTLNVNLTVNVEPSHLKTSSYKYLQKVVDDAGGIQPTTVTAE